VPCTSARGARPHSRLGVFRKCTARAGHDVAKRSASSTSNT
jgi:hypothetical protein